MRNFISLRVGAAVFLLATLVSVTATAQTTMQPANGPKPLLAEPQQPKPLQDGKPAHKPGDLPEDLETARAQMFKDFIAWRKNDDEIRKTCNTPHSEKERADCTRRLAVSESEHERINMRTRELYRKIDIWRYKEAGLPPPSWTQVEPPASNNTASGRPSTVTNSNAAAKQKDDAPLLPKSNTPLPAGTF